MVVYFVVLLSSLLRPLPEMHAPVEISVSRILSPPSTPY